MFNKITPNEISLTKVEEIETTDKENKPENLVAEEDIYVIAEDVKEEDYYTFEKKRNITQLQISDGTFSIKSDVSFEALEREVDKIMGQTLFIGEIEKT